MLRKWHVEPCVRTHRWDIDRQHPKHSSGRPQNRCPLRWRRQAAQDRL